MTYAARRPHLVVDISGHGLGHAGQMAPILRALRARLPEARLTVRSHVAAGTLARFMPPGTDYAPPPPDVGLLMDGPLRVDVPASLAAYTALDAGWDGAVAKQAAALTALAPDLVVADVPPVSIAAARRAGLPVIALCSLNWADVLAAYVPPEAETAMAPVVARLRETYHAADLFLRTTPHLPMDWLTNARSIGPVATVGRPAPLDLPQEKHRVLVTFGGVPGQTGLALPITDDIVWITSGSSAESRPDIVPADRLGLGIPDLLASVDAVVTKIGYGTLAEALAAGTRVLCLGRPDWPETGPLGAWIERHGRARVVDQHAALADARAWMAPLRALLDQPRALPVAPSGVDEAVAAILDLLPASRPASYSA